MKSETEIDNYEKLEAQLQQGVKRWSYCYNEQVGR